MTGKQLEGIKAAGGRVGIVRYKGDPPVRAEVLEVNVPRRVYSGARWDFSGHLAGDGVRVRYESGRNVGKEEVVGKRHVVGEWGQAKAEYGELAMREDARRAALDAEKAACVRAAEAITNAIRTVDDSISPRVEVNGRYDDPHGSRKLVGWRVTIDSDTATALAEALA